MNHMTAKQRLTTFNDTYQNLGNLGYHLGDFQTANEALTVLKASAFLDAQSFAFKKFGFSYGGQSRGIAMWGENEFLMVTYTHDYPDHSPEPHIAEDLPVRGWIAFTMSDNICGLLSTYTYLSCHIRPFYDLFLCDLPGSFLMVTLESVVNSQLGFLAHTLEVPSAFEKGEDYIDHVLVPLVMQTKAVVEVFAAKATREDLAAVARSERITGHSDYSEEALARYETYQWPVESMIKHGNECTADDRHALYAALDIDYSFRDEQLLEDSQHVRDLHKLLVKLGVVLRMTPQAQGFFNLPEVRELESNIAYQGKELDPVAIIEFGRKFMTLLTERGADLVVDPDLKGEPDPTE